MYLPIDAIRFLEVYMQDGKFTCCKWNCWRFEGEGVSPQIAG